MGPSDAGLDQYIRFVLARLARGHRFPFLRPWRTLVSTSSTNPASAAMNPFKLPLVALRVAQLLTVVYVEFAVTSILIETHANALFLDNPLLARVGLASLAVLWTAAVFSWSTCCNGARVLATPGMIGDAVTVAAYAVVAALSRGAGTADCGKLGDAMYIWSGALDAWIDGEGAALGPGTLVKILDAGFAQRECRFGKSAFGTAIANW